MLSCEYKSENTSTNSSIVKFPTIEYFESDVYLEEVLQSHTVIKCFKVKTGYSSIVIRQCFLNDTSK